MRWFRSILNDKKKIRDIRTGSILLLTLLLPLTVILFADSFNIATILNFTVGSIGISLGIGALLWWLEMSQRAFEDECEENDDIVTVNTHIKLQSEVDDVDLGIEYVNDYNDKQQELLNKIKSNNAIKLLERNIALRKVKGKRHKRLDKKLIALREKGLVDKTYKPIKFNDIISFNDTENKEELVGINRIKYNPKLDGIKLKIFFTFAKFSSIGAGVGLSLSLGISFSTLLWILGIYVLGLLFTTLKRYNNVRINTSTKYLIVRREKLKLIIDMNKYIKNKKENDVNE